MAYSIIWSKCPHCYKTIDLKFQHGSPSTSKLGEREIYTCKHCGNLISNGKKEWPEMSNGQKFYEIILFTFQTIFGGMIFGGVNSFMLFGFLFKMLEKNISTLAIISISIWFIISFLIGNGCKREVKESIDRYNKGQTKVTFTNDEEVILPYTRYAKTHDDIKLIMNNLKIINKRLSDIVMKISKLNDNNDLLKNEIQNNNTLDIIKNNERVLIYLHELYDKYVGMNIELFFSGLLYYLSNEDIKTINLKEKLNELEKSIKDYIYRYFPEDKTIDQIIDKFKFAGSIIKNVISDISDVKIKMIGLQSKSLISNISPIEIEKEYKSIIDNREYCKLSINLDELNKEYDRFFSEYEVTDDRLNK